MFCWMSWFGNKSKGVFSLLFCIYVSIIAKDISHLRQPLQENVPLFYCNKLKVKFGFFPVFIHLTSLSRYHLNQTLFFVLLPFCQFTSCHFRTCPSLPALVSHVFLPLQIFWPPHPPAHLLPVPPLAPHFMPLQPLFPACSIQVFLLSCVIFDCLLIDNHCCIRHSNLSFYFKSSGCKLCIWVHTLFTWAITTHMYTLKEL